jgi:GAF domain-containing protein/HAMP domain-containing protein
MAFLGLTIMLLIIVGAVGTALNRTTATSVAQARLSAVADLKAQAIHDWAAERKNDLSSLLSDQATADLVQRTLREPEAATLKQSLGTRLSRETLNQRGFQRVLLLDALKRSLVSTDPRLLDKDQSGQPYVNSPTAEPQIVLYYDVNLGSYQVAVTRHIFDSQRNPLGVLVGLADLDQLAQITSSGQRLGETDETYLVDAGYRFLTAAALPYTSTQLSTTGVSNALGHRQSGIDTYQNYAGTPVVGAYRYIDELGVALLTEQAVTEVYSVVEQQAALSVLVILGAILVASAGAYLITRRIVRPINNLAEVAASVAAGNLDQLAVVERKDQIGALAENFNTMTIRLRDLIDSLETRVEIRTAQVQASADVGRAATSILDPDQLLRQVVELIADRFGFYYVAAFTLDLSGQWAVLREAAGPNDAARLLKQAGHRLELSGNSLVGACIRDRRARIALDAGAEAVRSADPLLPDTRSEVALPLMMGDQVVGALDVHSTQVAAFDETSTAVLQNMADQIAVALNNAAQYHLEQNRAQQTTYLLEAVFELTKQTTVAELYTRIIAVTAALLRSDSAALWLPTSELELELQAASGPLQALIGQRLAAGEGVAGRVYATGLALQLNNVRAWNDATLDFGDAPVCAALATPMIWQGQPIGVLVAAHTLPDQVFTADDGSAAKLFAAQAASAIENVRLLERLQQTLNELSHANKRLTGEAWQNRLRDSTITYQHQPVVGTSAAAPPTASITVPIALRGQPIGQVVVEDDQPQRQFSADEQQLVQEVVQRMALALESARLFEQTQAALGEARRLAQRERLINRITAQVRGAVTVDEVLRIAVNEMRHSVGATYAAAQLTPPAPGNGEQGEDHDRK